VSRANLPLITIGITCYNAEDTIRRAVESSVRQTWSNREILVLDDCSRDGSRDILHSLALEYPEIRIIQHERNSGFPGALNTLLAEAQGEFIAFFDDDDESMPDRLQRQYERITTYEEAHERPIVLCYSNRYVAPLRNADFQRLGIGRHPPEPHGIIVADYILGLIRNKRYCWGMFGSCTLMGRVATFREFNGFDEHFRRCAELDFAIRAAHHGAHFISVDAPLITQYLTDTPDKGGDADLRYRLMLLNKHRAYLDSKRAYWSAVTNMYAWFHYTKGRFWRGRIWRAVALLLLPVAFRAKFLNWNVLQRRNRTSGTREKANTRPL
jgi:glycosyltransferase involved in cell wall biosynthesis